MSDVVAAVWLSLHADGLPLIMNIGSGHQVRVSDVAAMVERVTGRRIFARLNAQVPLGEASGAAANIELARHRLGYAPAIDLLDGLRMQWSHYRCEGG